MPGIRGIEKIEGLRGEERLAEMEEIDRKVEPFVPMPSIVVGEGSSSYQQGRSEGLKDFLSIGEKGSAPLFQERLDSTPAVSPSPEQPGEPGLLRSMAKFINAKLPEFFDGLPIAPVGPFMIFSVFLKRESFKVQTSDAFFERLNQYNQWLRGYDTAQATRLVNEATLTPEIEKILEDPWLKGLAEERLLFLEENAEHHRFLNDSSSEIDPFQKVYWKLIEHRAKGLGSQYNFGPGEGFLNEIALIQFSERLLRMAHQGNLPFTGQIEVPAGYEDARLASVTVHFIKAPELVGKGPDPRVILQVEFSKPIGREGYALLHPGEETLPRTDAPGRVLEGEQPETNTLFIVGGPVENHPEVFRLTDVMVGHFGWRRHEKDFWSEHAYLSGKSGATRGIYNNWIKRRLGFEIPVDSGGHPYSIQLLKEVENGKILQGAKRVRIEAASSGLMGINLPGDRQSQMIFKTVDGKEEIPLTLARNQSGYLSLNPDEIYLVTPFQADAKLQGFYAEEEIPFFWEPGKLYHSGLLSRLIGWFYEEGERPSESPKTEANPGFGPYRSPTNSGNGFFVTAEDGRRQAARLYPAGEESGFTGIGNPTVGPTRYYQLLKVELITHNLNGEQRIRLHLRRTNFQKQVLDQVLTLSVEEARNLGAISPGPEGKIFAHPKNFWLTAEPKEKIK